MAREGNDEQVRILREIWNEMKALNGRVDRTNDGLTELRGEVRELRGDVQRLDCRVENLLLGDDGKPSEVESRPLEWKRGLGLVLVKDEPGAYRSQLHALDMAGGRSTTHVDYELEPSPDLEAWSASWKDWNPDAGIS